MKSRILYWCATTAADWRERRWLRLSGDICIALALVLLIAANLALAGAGIGLWGGLAVLSTVIPRNLAGGGLCCRHPCRLLAGVDGRQRQYDKLLCRLGRGLGDGAQCRHRGLLPRS